MAAVVPSAYGLRAIDSTSFVFTATAAATEISNASIIAGVPTTNSPLYTFLNTAHADAAAANVAFRALGGRINMRQTGGAASTSTFTAVWVCTAAVPALTITGVTSTDYVMEVTIAVLHSIIQ